MDAAHWNGPAGATWVDQADALDTMLEQLGRAAMDLLHLRSGQAVVDIGCGSGATARELFRRVSPGGRVLGVDVSEPLIRAAERNGGGPHWQLADAGCETIDGARYDAAFSRFGLMFFDDPRAALAHIRLALEPKGTLAFVCWRTAAENAWAVDAAAALKAVHGVDQPPVDPHAPGPFAFGDGDRLRGLLASAGWSDIHVHAHNTDYVIGPTVEAAVELALRIGPAARPIRELGLDPGPFRDTLSRALGAKLTPRGVVQDAAVWLVTANA